MGVHISTTAVVEHEGEDTPRSSDDDAELLVGVIGEQIREDISLDVRSMVGQQFPQSLMLQHAGTMYQVVEYRKSYGQMLGAAALLCAFGAGLTLISGNYMAALVAVEAAFFFAVMALDHLVWRGKQPWMPKPFVPIAQGVLILTICLAIIGTTADYVRYLGP